MSAPSPVPDPSPTEAADLGDAMARLESTVRALARERDHLRSEKAALLEARATLERERDALIARVAEAEAREARVRSRAKLLVLALAGRLGVALPSAGSSRPDRERARADAGTEAAAPDR